ncbi:uncharacterized protein LOC111340236 [Stylophora pistillata]|uniref:uncharacterized protein LOC111340236 n=1 Tax=Stylophora pistillata TaxID=50429 RepID=UPI000C0491BA|nr:uncharacterized protein LOC111340236 [Stylophora pistillata]
MVGKKRAWSEDSWAYDVSDEEPIRIGEKYDQEFTGDDDVSDKELLRIEEEGQRGSGTPLFEFEHHPNGQPSRFKKDRDQTASFQADDPFDVDVTLVARNREEGGENVEGKGKRWLGHKKLAADLHDRRSILQVSNEDEMCCARAIWIFKSACDAFDSPTNQEPRRQYDNMRKNPQALTKRAKYLHREAGVPEGPCGRSELEAFQAYLALTYQLKVITACYPYGVLFEGHVTEPPQHIVRLLYLPPTGNEEIGHYHGCKSHRAFLERSYFYGMCNRGYDHEDFCHYPYEGRRCKACKQVACGSKPHQPTIYSRQCHRHFYDERCMAYHVTEGIFASWLRCELCCKEYTPYDDPHECYTSRCRACREDVDLTSYQCYIQSVEEEEDQPVKKPADLYKKQKRQNPNVSPYVDPPIFVYADFEAMIESDGTHTPILVRAETGDSDECHTFYGPECTGEFLDFLGSLIYGTDTHPIPKEESHDVICIFHKLKGYDSVFLKAQLLKEHRRFDFMIPNGTKQLSLSYGRVQFKDSFCYIPSSLAQFSSTFGIEEWKKGFFSSRVSHSPECRICGCFTGSHSFRPRVHVGEKMAEFEEWYREESARYQPPAVYDLKRELIDCCGSELKLLKAGCRKFVSEFRAVAGFNTIEKCVTIAQACYRYWRKRMMEEDSIALEPCSGWHGARPTHSLKSPEWLLWEERQRGIRIRRARNGGEVGLRLAGRTHHVDGYHEQSRTCFEFQGCLFHGCRTCFPDRKQVPHCAMGLNVEALSRQTLQKVKALRDAGYTVVEMWE